MTLREKLVLWLLPPLAIIPVAIVTGLAQPSGGVVNLQNPLTAECQP